MESIQSADAVKDRYIKDLGPQLGEQFHALMSQITFLHAKWETYMTLYGHSPARVAILNEGAPFYFRITQDVLLNDVLLDIARLTDAPSSGAGQQNLTLRRLPSLVDKKRDRASIQRACDAAIASAEFCRTLRNKRLAHNDLDHLLGRPAVPLAGVSRKKIADTLEAMVHALNSVTDAYDGGMAIIEDVTPPGGAESMFRRYELGLKTEKAQWAKRRAPE